MNHIYLAAYTYRRVHPRGPGAGIRLASPERTAEAESVAIGSHLATQYPYDDLDNEGAEITLRGSTSEIAEKLGEALSRRLRSAGIEIIEARLNHLAYAPEIASAMLQRQQAKAEREADAQHRRLSCLV